MSLKEQPLFNAVSRLGPLPNFLFSNMIFVGFFAMVMCAVFGGVFVAFQAAGHGAADFPVLFEAARWGGIIGVIIGAVTFISIGVSAFYTPEEAKVRLLFVFGGVLAIATLVISDHLALEPLRGWLATLGPVAGPGF